MGVISNAAFAGTASLPNGSRAVVEYLDKDGLKKHFGYQPPGHPRRKLAGWYWQPYPDRNAIHGPFTSSRKAIKDAIDCNRQTAALEPWL